VEGLGIDNVEDNGVNPPDPLRQGGIEWCFSEGELGGALRHEWIGGGIWLQVITSPGS